MTTDLWEKQGIVGESREQRILGAIREQIILGERRTGGSGQRILRGR